MAGATFAALYVAGLIVVNIYLAQFDFFAFSYARPQYILTGLWTALLFGVTVLPVTAAVYRWRRKRGRIGSLRSSGGIGAVLSLIAVSLVALAVSPAIWFGVLRLAGADSLAWLSAIGLFFVCLMFGLALLAWFNAAPARSPDLSKAPTAGPEQRASAIGLGIVTAVNLLLFAEVFALTAYPLIVPAFGGGKPQRARVVLEAAAAADLARLGFPLRRGTNISLPVSIVGEGGDEVLVKTDTVRYRLQKGVVKAANPKNYPEDVLWEQMDLRDIQTAAIHAGTARDCPKDEIGRVNGRIADILRNFDIQLKDADLSWQCGLTCYDAVHYLEELAAEEGERCKPGH